VKPVVEKICNVFTSKTNAPNWFFTIDGHYRRDCVFGILKKAKNKNGLVTIESISLKSLCQPSSSGNTDPMLEEWERLTLIAFTVLSLAAFYFALRVAGG
jgi:hypothetical protein